MLPTREKCLQLLDKYGLYDNMVKHSLEVEKISVYLAKKFNETGIRVDTEFVSRAALLHDVDKTETIKEGFEKEHGKMGQRILEKEGYPEIGAVALTHHLFRILEKNPFGSLEEKIVFYADKRVNNYNIVSLNERFDYLFERYGKTKEIRDKFASCKKSVEKLEEEIFSKIKADKSLEELK